MLPLPASITLKGIWAALIALAFAVLLALLVALSINTYANLRWEGPFGISLGFEGWKPRAVRMEAERDAVFAAAVEARAAQIAVNRAEQERLDTVAQEAQDGHETRRPQIADATDRHIERNRVPAPGQCVASTASAPADGDSASTPAEMPADAVVLSASDVRLFGEWVNYGMTCNAWALGLVGETD